MHTLIESTLVTLDGVIENPASWAGPYLDEDFQKAAFERLERSDAMLMGRRTYELLERDWATQSGDFADLVNAVPKYVFSATLGNAGWNNARLVRDDAVDAVRKLKADGDRELSIWGHGRLARTLLQNGLIDEIRLSVFPIIVGAGQTFFAVGGSAPVRLIEALPASAKGIVALRYAPAR
jgi:dihydrofolate reductase